MDQPVDIVEQIERSLDMTATVVAGIGADQWTAQTPCAGWDVRAVLNHTVGGMHIFAAELTGQPAAAEHEADWLGDDPQGRFASAAETDRAAWRRPDSLAGSVTISLGRLPGPMAAVVHLTEVLVHGVDLAVATGQQDVLDQGLCADLLATMRAMGIEAFRVPGVFGPEVTPTGDAAPHEQLAAYLGRDLRLAAAAPRP